MIYLDNNATTVPLPEVVAAVTDTLQCNWGNPSSAHASGHRAREALENARNSVARVFGAESPSCITFTSSGTESINLACACLLKPEITRIIVASTEHSAVLRASERWAQSRPVVLIPVDSNGILDLAFLDAELAKSGQSLVCVALANNETGVVTEIPSVSSLCQRHNALLHVDAVQAAAKIPLCLASLHCDAASLSAHKFHGSPGCGILYLKSPPASNVHGRLPSPGHQEGGLRGGTENLPSIVGCGLAARMLGDTLQAMPDVAKMRDQLEQTLIRMIPGSEIHGSQAERLPNTISIFCPHRNAADLVSCLSSLEVAVSAGAACSNATTPSHVIRAMGHPESRANSTLRISLCRSTTAYEVSEAAAAFAKAFVMTPPTR